MFVSGRCKQCGPLKVIGQLVSDGIGCKTGEKFVSSHWSVVVSFDPSMQVRNIKAFGRCVLSRFTLPLYLTSLSSLRHL